MRHPDVPESLDGWWILHRMFSFDRRSWDEEPQEERANIVREATAALESLKRSEDADVGSDVEPVGVIRVDGDGVDRHVRNSGCAGAVDAGPGRAAVDGLEDVTYVRAGVEGRDRGEGSERVSGMDRDPGGRA